MSSILGMFGGGSASSAAAGTASAGSGGLLGLGGDMAQSLIGPTQQISQGIGNLDVLKTLEGLDSLVAARDALPGQVRGGLLNTLRPADPPTTGPTSTQTLSFQSALGKAIEMKRRRRPIGSLGQ
jgi:hypothetical protein